MTTCVPPLTIRNMTDNDTLSTILYRTLARRGWSKAEGARRAGMSYRQFIRYLDGDSGAPRPKTLDKLERLGIPRKKMALATYGRANVPQ